MFKLREHQSRPLVEISAGLTTFCAMAYVLAANPAILAQAGAPAEALFTATALAAIFGSLSMAFIANLPFAVAPGMGINAIFAFVAILGLGLSWPQAVAAALTAGGLFFLLSLSPLREKILREIPPSLQYAVCGGVGLLIAGLGLIDSGAVVFNNGLPALGQLRDRNVQLFFIGLFLTAGLLALKFRYAVLAGIILTTFIGWPLGITILPAEGLGLSLPPSPAALWLNPDFSRLTDQAFISTVFIFLFLAIFDSLGGFLGLFSIMGPEAEARYRFKLGRAFVADSVAVILSGLLGISPNTTYGESGTGVALGGRTGLTALTVAACFTLALFCAPLFLAIPFPAVAPALVVVGWYMLSPLTRLDFSDPTESFPAVLAVVLIGLSWRISDSLGVAWLVYILMKAAAGRGREINATVGLVGLVFVAKLAWDVLN
ncbi:MAG: NCS2 family permease [Candidatus Adiutrix sp.]|jgi:AGZA family xanthine/uracil permease-like MFS transporter|nr:NCS2 family permease [Candidatus Adiutrix sp.]